MLDNVHILYIFTGFLSVCFLLALWIIKREVLKPLTIIIDLSVSPFNSIRLCINYFEALLSSKYIFRIVMSPWLIYPFILMKWCSLFLVIFFPLKSTLCDITCLSSILLIRIRLFFHHFTFILSVSLYLKLVSWRQQVFSIAVLTNSYKLGDLKQCKFTVI